MEIFFARFCALNGSIRGVNPAILWHHSPFICEIFAKAEFDNFVDCGLDKPRRLVLAFVHELFDRSGMGIECLRQRGHRADSAAARLIQPW